MNNQRPTEAYKKYLFELILIDIAEMGRTVRNAVKGRVSFPCFFQWLEKDENMAKQYARSLEIRTEVMAAEILDIADDSSQDIEIREFNGTIIERENKEFIQRSRVRIDARKWLMSKMNPKKYSDKLDITSKDEKLESSPQIIFIPSNDHELNGN